MKIALVTDKFIVGGGLEHIYQIARGMQNIQFGVFANGGDAAVKVSTLPNVTVFRHGNLPRHVLKFEPDLIHIHHLKPLLNFYLNPFKKYHIPVLFTVHGLHIHKYEFKKGISNTIKFYLRYYLEQYLFHRVTKLITVSVEDGKFIGDQYHAPSVCIPNGLDISKIECSENSKSIRNELNLPPDIPLFLTVARFDFQKGYDILLRTISMIKDEIHARKIKFVFVGHGKLFNEMKQMAAGLEINDLIIFMGARNDVYRLMRACDLFILPSRWEGLPIVLIEAGLCKLPIIASDTYGNREVVKDRVNGLLFRNKDSEGLANVLMQVMKKRDSIEPIRDRAYTAFKTKYDIGLMVSKLQDIYLSNG
jgi:glycosyltransferase involved in cell wall biosynthesis